MRGKKFPEIIAGKKPLERNPWGIRQKKNTEKLFPERFVEKVPAKKPRNGSRKYPWKKVIGKENPGKIPQIFFRKDQEKVSEKKSSEKSCAIFFESPEKKACKKIPRKKSLERFPEKVPKKKESLERVPEKDPRKKSPK